MNPRGASYAFINCPCLILCPRGVVQFVCVGVGVCVVPVFTITGELLVHRLSIGFSVVLICHWLLNSAHSFTGAAG